MALRTDEHRAMQSAVQTELREMLPQVYRRGDETLEIRLATRRQGREIRDMIREEAEARTGGAVLPLTNRELRSMISIVAVQGGDESRIVSHQALYPVTGGFEFRSAVTMGEENRRNGINAALKMTVALAAFRAMPEGYLFADKKAHRNNGGRPLGMSTLEAMGLTVHVGPAPQEVVGARNSSDYILLSVSLREAARRAEAQE